MSSWIRKLTLSVIIGASLVVLSPASIKADDYWDGYWSWYDNSYRPYYYRQYSYPGRSYGGYSTYGPSYYPRAGYYGTPSYGYYQTAPGVQVAPGAVQVAPGGVQVGPLRFGWR